MSKKLKALKEWYLERARIIEEILIIKAIKVKCSSRFQLCSSQNIKIKSYQKRLITNKDPFKTNHSQSFLSLIQILTDISQEPQLIEITSTLAKALKG